MPAGSTVGEQRFRVSRGGVRRVAALFTPEVDMLALAPLRRPARCGWRPARRGVPVRSARLVRWRNGRRPFRPDALEQEPGVEPPAIHRAVLGREQVLRLYLGLDRPEELGSYLRWAGSHLDRSASRLNDGSPVGVLPAHDLQADTQLLRTPVNALAGMAGTRPDQPQRRTGPLQVGEQGSRLPDRPIGRLSPVPSFSPTECG